MCHLQSGASELNGESVSPDLLRHGAAGSQDNAFNQLPVPLPLLLLGADEVERNLLLST